MNCGNNIFDQSEIESGAKLETIYKIYSCSNLVATNDIFIGLRSPAYRVYQSVDVGITPTNFAFRSAEIYDHKHPVIVQLIQQCKNVVIENFKVNNISNPDNVTEIGETRLRLVDIYMSLNNGKGIEGVLIQNNQIIESSDNFVLLYAYKNNVSVTGYIKNIFVKNNTSLNGAAICRFGNGQNLGYFLFAENNMINPTIAIGATPPELALSNNLPKPSLSYSLVGGVLKAGATRRIAQTVYNTSLGDFVRASLSVAFTNLSIVANVPSNNNVEVLLTNTTASDISIPDCTLNIDVDKR